jgi:O-antigen/teichoic acid export membrane protein
MTRDAVAARHSLRYRFFRAGSWTVLAYAATLVLRLGSSLILTRLLAPEAFGLVAIVSTIGMVVALLSDIGIRQAVVHSVHGDERQMLDTAWSMQILRGFLIWAVCCLIALVLYGLAQVGWVGGESVYASPLLAPLLALGTLHSVISGFETTKRYTADRRIDQVGVVLIELGSMFIGILVTIALAAWMRSVWAIVIGGSIGSICSVLAGHRWLHGHPNRLAWNPVFARSIFDYGKWILASSLLYVAANNGDKLLLGIWVAPATLGCFAIAQNLAQVLELAIGRVFSQVAAPAFGDIVRSNPERLREVYLRMRLPFDLIFIVAAGFIFAVGPWVIALLYDPRYAAAGTVLEILSFSLLFARYGLSNSAWLALQAPQAQAVMNLVRMVAFLVLVPLSYKGFGTQGAYWAIALYSVTILPVVWWYDHRFGLLSWRHEILALTAWPLGWAGGMAFLAAARMLGA